MLYLRHTDSHSESDIYKKYRRPNCCCIKDLLGRVFDAETVRCGGRLHAHIKLSLLDALINVLGVSLLSAAVRLPLYLSIKFWKQHRSIVFWVSVNLHDNSKKYIYTVNIFEKGLYLFFLLQKTFKRRYIFVLSGNNQPAVF